MRAWKTHKSAWARFARRRESNKPLLSAISSVKCTLERRTMRTVFSWITLAALAAMPALAQAYRAPRMADGHPNFNGIWQAMNTANWDLQDHSAAPGTM